MSKKSVNSSQDEAEYIKLNPREHVLKRPGMYIGTIDSEEDSQQWIYNKKEKRFEKKSILYNHGLYKIFDEIIVNAKDHTMRSKTCKNIKVNFNKEKGEISVWNDGDGVPVKLHEKEGIYIPELIFGNMLAGSNFDDNNKRVVGGMNGIGAKAANIFSKTFIVETLDNKNKKKYIQKFENNMKDKCEPKITNVEKGEKPYTKITFIPDFEKFHLDGMSDDMIALFGRRAHDIALCTLNNDVKVMLDDKQIKIKKFTDYVKMYYSGSIKPVFEKCNNRWSVCAVYDSEAGYNQISFVNGLYTPKGGKHVQYIFNQIADKLIALIKKDKDTKDLIIKPQQIKEFLTLFVDCVIENPDFIGQTKDSLSTNPSKFGSTCEISDEFIEKLAKTGIKDDIIALAKFNQSKKLKKSDGKKVKKVNVPKYEPAEFAGTRKSKDCRVIFTEGDSAAAFVRNGLKVIDPKREYFGIFPLRGKVLNVKEVSDDKLAKNKEFVNIKTILGLKQGVEYENSDKLRYGGIIILTDQDVDGSHIKGLVMNMFHTMWPSLLKLEGFIQTLATPIVKAFKKTDKKHRNPIIFYSMTEYKNWCDSTPDINKWEIKYYKGLGTSDDIEAKLAFENFDERVVSFIWESNKNTTENKEKEFEKKQEDEEDKSEDEEKKSTEKDNLTEDSMVEGRNKSENALTLAFSKQRANDRKIWLGGYDESDVLDYNVQRVPISDFINKDLIHFSNYDNLRSIPGIDGLKPSQRKIIYGMIKGNYKKDVKVSSLAGEISTMTEYHHGQVSLEEAIIAMAQNFVGSNNINLLEKHGQFGTRMQGGSDHAASRYITSKLSNITRFIFRPEDDAVLEYLNEEGKDIEPKTFAPIIPLILINGTKGIGTGFSTYIPTFNPKEVINNVRNLINEKEINDIIPWFRNFKGEIKSITDKGIKKYMSYGKVDKITGEKGKLRITELPVEVWTESYFETLDKITLRDSKKHLLADHGINIGGNHDIDITIELNSDKWIEVLKKNDNDDLMKKLKLMKSIAISNMHMYNADNKIMKYEFVEDIFYDFYDYRYKMYDKRRNYMIRLLTNEMLLAKYKALFIEKCINEEIIIAKKRDKKLVHDQLEELKFPKLSNNIDAKEEDKTYDYTEMNIYSQTEEKVEELRKIYEEKKKKLEDYKKTTIEQLWTRELDELEEKYDKWLAEQNDDLDEERKIEERQKKNGNKRGKKNKNK